MRVLIAAAVATVLLAAPAAEASYDPVAGGTTRLAIDSGFARILAANGVRVTVQAGVRRRGSNLLLPVGGGRVDPAEGKAEIECEGSLVFERGRRRVPLRRIVVKTKPQPLVAKVGGSQLKVAAAGDVRFERVGFGAQVSARPLRLTDKFATRLSKKLRLRGAFEGGQLLGTLRSEAQPRTLAVLPVGRVTFTPDPAFLAKLDGLFVSVNPIAPAERSPGPLFSLPLIPAGTIAPDGSAGVTRSGGALEFLQLGAGQIFWQELWFDLATHQVLAEVDLEPTPTFPGRLGQVAVASLAGGAVSQDLTARAVAVSGAVLNLTESSASHFNQAFAGGKAEFHAADPLGTVAFVASTQ